MKLHHRHLNLARRKMNHIIGEIYMLLLHCGSREVDLRIRREEAGLRLLVKGGFLEEYREDIERMAQLLRPAVRSAAMVEMYWELAGEDQYTGESEMALVGQMADEAKLDVDGQQVSMELFVAY